MSHLSPAEFIDLADGTLPRDRAAHLDGCEECRAQVATVRDALTVATASDDVPEPSPLFWEHFSARVRQAVEESPRRPVFAFSLRALHPLVASLAVVVLVASAVLLTREARSKRSTVPATAASAAAATDQNHVADSALLTNHAAEWAVLTAAAADLELDDARKAGMDVPSAAVDRAVTQLTPDELSELGRLLQSELKRSGD